MPEVDIYSIFTKITNPFNFLEVVSNIRDIPKTRELLFLVLMHSL